MTEEPGFKTVVGKMTVCKCCMGADQKVMKISNQLSFCNLLTPPNLPKGEEQFPLGGFRGSKVEITFNS